jgi:hypothetical protein
MERYRIARDGKEINEYDIEAIRGYLANGNLRPTDHAWKAGMDGWKTLAELGIVAAAKATPPLASASAPNVGRVVTPDAAGGLICADCGCVGHKVETPGSFAMEICLYLVFCFPGIIYTLWRIINKGKVCSACGSKKLVPINSPVGRQLRGI